MQLAKLVVTFFPQPIWFLIFDDTFIYRNSKKAPGSNIHHQHGNKANRPQYARGQCWVTMALSITSGMKLSAVPLLSRLMRKRGFHAIGQVRRDTALYAMPVRQQGKGRPRKYGEKYTPELVATLKEHRRKVFLYGKWQWVRYRSAVCLAKFMKGCRVRAVWMQFEDSSGNLSKQRLLLSTCATLTAEEVFRYYARRWSIEDLFNQMKNRWGWRESWQQSRQVLHRWTQIISVAFALPQLLAIYCGDQVENLMHLTP